MAEKRGQLGQGDVVLDEGLADAAHQHQRKLAAFDFFVLGHQPQQIVGRGLGAGNRRDLDRQADRFEMTLDPGGIFRRAQPALDREGEGQPHTDRDRLAMQQPVGIAGERFERMAEGVAEIEQRAGAGLFPLVGRRAPPGAEKISLQLCSSQAKNGASPISPYFTTSA
jgi:hypothetical protein